MAIRKLLIANRGEIAVRIIRAAREMGVKTVAIYSDADRGALHVRLADEAIALGGALARDSYLHQERVLDACRMVGADAVHPGYGLFAENGEFARAVLEAGLVFVGPAPEVISLMGDKERARKTAVDLGVPVIPGVSGSSDELRAFADRVGYPVIIKAVAGGSGRGMRVVRGAEELDGKRREAEEEAQAAFKNGAVFLERYLERPRHIEVQVVGDSHGSVVHLGERECSIQRRHQKVIEESPAVRLSPKLRGAMCDAALRLARAVDYTSSGTVEFLVENADGDDGQFYFIEMNTRIQVEHPVTELVTGVDLVKLQLRVAAGERLGFRQEDVAMRGHAIEFRISAERPEQSFAPVAGQIRYMSRAGGPGVREDGWAESGTKLSAYYDSLLTKLIVSGGSRGEALARARRLFDEFLIDGVETTLPFHRWILDSEDFLHGSPDVYWVSREFSSASTKHPATAPLRLGDPHPALR